MGSFKVIFVPRASRDLQDIVSFVAKRSLPETAERLGTSLILKALSLEEFPERGRIVPERGDKSIREVIFKSYRIVYRIRGKQVEVFRFWHAARGAPEIDSDEFGGE